ncbi:hypothetical protein FACS1894137_14840 [Spirochaetia bacterium]|nr:hypothetical protein FACS1894137_14840 [Spirochaetia bacterium]
MPASRPVKKPILVILVKRAALFFFFLCLLAVYLYGIGTAQEFMDRTQLLLLRLCVINGISVAVASAYGIILNLWFILHKRKYRFPGGGAGMYIVLLLFGIAIAVLAAFIIVLAGGNRP